MNNIQLVFREPAPKHIQSVVDTLTALTEHPGKWAVVAESVPPNTVQMWRQSRGRVGAQGFFKVRQQKANDLGQVDIFVRYDEERTR